MRVFALAVRDSRASAIGRVELECTPPGLVIGFSQVAAYTEGYLPGATTNGTRVLVPYGQIKEARIEGEQIHLAFESDTIPHDRMTLSRFAAGPGVPLQELRKRRLILHLGALGVATIFALVVLVLTRAENSGPFGWSPIQSALGYGGLAAGLILALGYGLDQRFFLRDPREDEVRRMFAADLATHLPSLQSGEPPSPASPKEWIERLAELLPSSVTVTAATLAAALLTALFTGTRLLRRESALEARRERAETYAMRAEPENRAAPAPTAPVPRDTPKDDAPQEPLSPSDEPPEDSAPSAKAGELSPERNCVCDRADSPLWDEPLPRLSALLLDSRVIPRETHNRLEVDVAVVNNGDEPISELTLHVVFSEKRGTQNERTKERPLYFEGPLGPGKAIKWTTEARGDSFRILAPDFGKLGQNGEGAASREAFHELLDARNRPVRLHAVRVMSYLGDPRAHAEALKLKDAYRAREAPFLRRVLAATGELRVCDLEVKTAPEPSVGVCVHNASSETKTDLGIVVGELDQKFDPAQPLANPPQLEAEYKWKISGSLGPDSGKYVRAPVPPGFASKPGHAVEVMADRFDLLE
jgi:hypothetical protein